MDHQSSTTEKLVAAATTLFAERGFRATTVGDIEEAAGLSRRAGGFYRHFESKRAVLLAAVDGQARGFAEYATLMADVEALEDLRGELLLSARWALRLLRAQRPLLRIVERDGWAFPELAERFHADVIDRGRREAVGLVERWQARGRFRHADAEATAALMIGALVGYERERDLTPPGAERLDDERLIAGWVTAWLALADHDPEERSRCASTPSDPGAATS